MQNLLLLHGAIGAKDQLGSLAGVLKNDFIIHTLSFTGHGGNNIPDAPFSIELFAQDVLKYMEEHKIEKTHIFGYSMGGYVGFYLTKYYPEKIIKLVTLATKVYWDEAIAAKETKLLNADVLEQKLPAFAAQLAQRHAPQNWKMVLSKVCEMLVNLGQNNTLSIEDYTSINTPCLVMLGDRDKMVTLDETVAVYKQLPVARLGVLPGTPHPLEQVDKGLLAFMIKEFLS
ncbi:MAG TPA: alpha/beta hydrolase [Panacibacter sp.]|nr:alpha/beta hydrolase [Panacibacter sp.]